MLRKIYFYGKLAKKFGDGPHEFEIDNMAQLFAGFNSRFPGFKQEFLRDEWAIIRGSETKKKAEQIPPEELGMKFKAGYPELHFIPKSEGSISAAAAYVAEAILGAAAEGTLAYSIVYAAAYVVLSLVSAYAFSALSAALSPNPNSGNQGTGKQEADHQSFLFSGPQNVIEQGGPVPLVYGEFRTGSTVVSIGIAPEEIPVT